MSNYARDLSNLSYTNKDFAEIYPELLDLAKKISYKWDPSLSDESDPGVVLLKIAALMADKCNYNIDKNVLELFPVSVTQLANARQLFEQCGYTMRYYQSATTELALRMLNEPDITDTDVTAMLGEGVTISANTLKTDSTGNYLRHYIIPRFTMFSDVDNSVVYTTTEDVTIFSDGTTSTVPVIQGALNEYQVNGSKIITVDMLDSNNRVYFTELNIPENGIFISNVDSVDRWTQCDNLLLEPLGTCCYKFGLTLDGLRCYVEFPSDIDTLIGNGININYVITSGTDGNVRKNLIRQFFSDPEIVRKVGSSFLEQKTKLTTDNIYITNEIPAVNGRNPETISEAYKNYERVKTTFETLVSTKDYTDFLITNEDVSNCVVCDRYDDVQSAYTVLTDIDGEAQQIPHTKTHMREYQVSGSASLNGGETWLNDNVLVKYQSEEPEMTAFDLRVYGLKYVDGITDYKSFSSSFDILDSRIYNSIDSSTAAVKCLAHDYKPFETDRIILLKNRYPIVARVVSPYKLTFAQQDEILGRIKLNLFNLLNSKAIKFGQEIDYNEVYSTILKSDPRISGVILEEIVYETYAVYFSSSTQSFESMRIDSKSVPPDSTKEEERARLQDLWNEFRTEVYTRSVLSGKTPLFVPDSVFVYSLAHEQAQNGDLTYEVETMSTSVDIPLTYNGLYTLTSRELKENDVITLTSPNLILDKRYANYVQYVTNIGCADGHPNYGDENLVVVEKDEEYVLQNGEYIIFFWRTSDSSTECYTYVKYTGRKSTPVIICPSFDMIQQPNTANLSNVVYTIDDTYFETLGDYGSDYSDGIQLTVPRTEMYPQANASFVDKTLVPKEYKDADENIVVPPAEISLNDLINRYFIGERFNVKSNTIETRKINEIKLTAEDKGTSKFYWILNTVVDGKYRLFPASTSDDDDEYTLQEGEQLIYSNDNLTQLYVLGAGTLIRRHKKDSRAACGAWEVPALEHTLEFLSVGPRYFEDSSHPWFNIKKQAVRFDLYATEMAYRKLSAKTRLSIHIPTDDGSTLELQQAKYFIGSSGIFTDQGKDPGFKSHLVTYTITNEFGEEEKLAIRKHESLKWVVSSSLNLKLSTTEPMRLYSHQKLSWLPHGEYSWIEVEGSDSEEFYIQSDRTITKSGGSNLDVRYYDILRESYVPLQIYIYKLKDVNLSSSEDTNNYNLPWQFSSDGITVSGRDVRLTNISLPQGDYILPITMSNVNYPIDVYWDELRKLKSSKLTQNEVKELGNIQLVPRGALQTDDSDWNSARRPVELADVVKWLYGSIYVDVSDEFQNETIVSAFKKMFVTPDTSLQDPNADNTGNFSLRSSSDVEASATLLDMLQSYGGSKFSSSTGITACNPGDVIALRIDEATEGLPVYKYQIWVYMPCTDTSYDPYVKVEYGPGIYTICERDSKLADSVAAATYYYHLRPDNVADSISEGSPKRLADTVTRVRPLKNGTYYYMVSSKGTSSDGSNSTYNLRLVCDIGTANPEDVTMWPSYVILDLTKYTKPTLTSTDTSPIEFFDNILSKLREMDINSLFNYTYDVPDSDLVMYPLDSISFLDSNHPMNRFTICQYVINESKTRSDLVVVGRYR